MSDPSGPQPSLRPSLAEITPDSGPAGQAYPIQATLIGQGFAATGNSVVFGPVTIADLPSSTDGSRLTFSVPKIVPSSSEVPPLVLGAGQYLVTAMNAAGASNAVLFTLLEAPVLTEIQPKSGPAGVAYPIQATVLGRGFAPTNNTVVFGPVTISNVPSSMEGTQITFPVPKVVPSSGEVQPLVLGAGPYTVTVANSAGTSNPVTFVLTQNP